MALGGRPDKSREPKAPPIPVSATCLVAATTVLAVLLLRSSWAGYQAAEPAGLGLAVAAALLCGSRSIRLANCVGTVSVGSVIVFAALLHLGVAEGCVVGALSGLGALLLSPERHRRPPAVIVFSVASVVVTAWAAGQVFGLLGGRSGAVDLHGLAVPAALAATAYYVVNCLLVGTVASLTSGVRLRTILAKYLGPTALSYYAGAALAVLVHVAWLVSGTWVLMAGVPLLCTVHTALSRCAAHVEAAHRRREEYSSRRPAES